MYVRLTDFMKVPFPGDLNYKYKKRKWHIHVFVSQATILFSWVKYTGMEGEKFPEWSDALGWLMTLTVIVCIVGGAVYQLVRTEGDFKEVKCGLGHRMSN